MPNSLIVAPLSPTPDVVNTLAPDVIQDVITLASLQPDTPFFAAHEIAVTAMLFPLTASPPTKEAEAEDLSAESAGHAASAVVYLLNEFFLYKNPCGVTLIQGMR